MAALFTVKAVAVSSEQFVASSVHTKFLIRLLCTKTLYVSYKSQNAAENLYLQKHQIVNFDLFTNLPLF